MTVKTATVRKTNGKSMSKDQVAVDTVGAILPTATPVIKPIAPPTPRSYALPVQPATSLGGSGDGGTVIFFFAASSIGCEPRGRRRGRGRGRDRLHPTKGGEKASLYVAGL